MPSRRHKAARLFSGLLLGAIMALPLASAAQTIGYIKTVQGAASVTRDGVTEAAVIGHPLRVGDTLLTARDGSLGLTLKDDTMMSLGPNSELLLDSFLFEPAASELGLSARLTSGTLQFVSGIISKLKPESVAIDTPTATIGVRGTRFLVKVKP